MSEPVLSGLRVVEISAFVAAPLCGVALASLGADVVRIDPLGGGIDLRRWPLHDGKSLYWLGLNQGKRSVTINSRTTRGRELIADLIAAAGACITNLPVAEWMSYETLAARRRDLIMVTITGNRDGSVAVDYTVNAAVGFPWITGPEGWDGPVNHVLPAWDVIAAQTATTAVIAAELRRSRSGEGSSVTLSLADVALTTVAHLGLLAEAELDPKARGRYGNDLYGSFGRDFRTRDGRSVIVIALTRRQWRSLIAVTESQERISAIERAHKVSLDDEGDRFAHRSEINDVLSAWIGARDLDAVRTAFDAAGVLWSPYQTFKELVRDDPRASESNPLFTRIRQPDVGSILAAGSPLEFSGVVRRPQRPAPTIGANTRELLREWLHLPPEQLHELAVSGVIGD